MAKPFPLQDPIRSTLQLKQALGLVWRTARGWTLLSAALSIIEGVLPLAALYATKRLLDAVSATLAAPAGESSLQGILPWLVLAGLVALLTALMRSLGEHVTRAHSLQVTDAVADVLHAQSIAVDLAYYEDASYYDTLHRAQVEAPYRPTRIVNGLIRIARNSISLLGILGLLISFNGLLALALLLAALPGALLRLMHARRLFDFEQKQTENERRAWYYHGILTHGDFAKELRLFDLGELFKDRYHAIRQQIRAGRLELSRRRILTDLLAQGLAIAALFGSLTWITLQTVRGQVTVGDLVIYYLGFQNGLSYLQAVLHALADLYEDNLFLTNLYQFLDLEPRIHAPAHPQPVPQPMPRRITFHNISFTYPGQPAEALHNIELQLEPGQVIALVGENGSGKTTLVKLLCRLVDPTHGEICVDGIDLRELDPVQWRRQISVTFQDYAHYALKAGENIWLGDIQTPYDAAGIARAAQSSGADEIITQLPQGYDSMLGHWFYGGKELSGGEWQKIALARAFWRKAGVLILDEPSSALDPLAEEKLFQNFRSLLDGRSGILISHRFSTVQMADHIYVLDEGRILEHGSHADLLQLNGRYARLYHAQAQHYREQA